MTGHPHFRFWFTPWHELHVPAVAVAPSDTRTEDPPPPVPSGGATGAAGVSVVNTVGLPRHLPVGGAPPAAPSSNDWLYRKAAW